MLQWMGGSRRKVTTSRKSTQKRQKQYFEQRKRQQQQQQTAGLESCADGINTSGKHLKEHRSLDVLSLLNLSTISQACKASCPDGREDSEVNASTANYHTRKCPPTFLINTVAPADPVEIKEARTPSGYEQETVSSKNHGITFNGDGDQADLWKPTEHPLSILDLLGVGDDRHNGNSEGNPVHEDHVAFSIEGLGKVGTETPVLSPQQPIRISSYGCSSPLKAPRQLHSSKNLDYVHNDLELEVDAMMQDVNMLHSVSSMELPSYSRGMMHSFNNSKDKLSTCEDSTELYGHSSKIQNSFSDGKIFYDIEDDKETIWKDRSSFLDDNFLDEREYDIPWKNWPSQMKGKSLDLFESGKHGMSNIDFEGPHLLKKRDNKKATGSFKILEPAPYYKPRASENDHEFVTSDQPRYHTVGRNFDFRDATNRPNWSVFATEDARDSLHSPSEESSCSSSAVRGKATQNSPSNSMARKSMRRQGNHFNSPECSVKNIFDKEIRFRNRDEIQRGKNGNESGKFTRMSNHSRSKPAYYSNSTSQKKLEPYDGWLFEEGYPSVEINSGDSSFFQTLEAKCASSGSKLWAENPFGVFPVPKLHINAESSFQRSKHGVPVEYSRSGSFFSKNPAFSQPFNCMDSYDSPIFSNIGFGPTKPDSSPDFEMEGIYQHSSHFGGSHGDLEFPDLSVQESVSKDGQNESKIHSTDFQTFKVEKGICIGNNGLSSEKKKHVDASDFNDDSRECKEAKDETSELIEILKAAYSPEHAEETSSSVKMPDKIESSVDKKEYHNDAQISFLCPNGNKEIEDVGQLGERKITSEEQKNCVNPSHQVMMLESYVLQLLCVQKVLKETSAQHTMKKSMKRHGNLFNSREYDMNNIFDKETGMKFIREKMQMDQEIYKDANGPSSLQRGQILPDVHGSSGCKLWAEDSFAAFSAYQRQNHLSKDPNMMLLLFKGSKQMYNSFFISSFFFLLFFSL